MAGGGVRMLAQLAARSSGEILMPMVSMWCQASRGRTPIRCFVIKRGVNWDDSRTDRQTVCLGNKGRSLQCVRGQPLTDYFPCDTCRLGLVGASVTVDVRWFTTLCIGEWSLSEGYLSRRIWLCWTLTVLYHSSALSR